MKNSVISKTSIKKKAVVSSTTIDIPENTTDITHIIRNKITSIQEIIQKTILSVSQNKKWDLFSNSDYVICVSSLNELYEKTRILLEKMSSAISSSSSSSSTIEIDTFITDLQPIVDKMSVIISNFGTESIDDLLSICFGTKQMCPSQDITKQKFALIQRFVHPIGFKTVNWKQNHIAKCAEQEYNVDPICNNKITEEIVAVELSNNLECYEIETHRCFHTKITGIRVIIQHETLKKTLIISGIVDELELDCINNQYIESRKTDILENIERYSSTADKEIMKRILETFTVKDILIYGDDDVYKKSILVRNTVNSLKMNKLEVTISKFVSMDTFSQRNHLIQLLLYNVEDEIHYTAYLLYDTIAKDPTVVVMVDSAEQKVIYDSFPWKIKLLFKDAMKNTIKYTQDIATKFDMNRVSLEQQVYLMKAPEAVKERAFAKLKEIKNKNDESCSKAKQYLEGLLRIPFEIYKKEPVLCRIKEINQQFIHILSQVSSAASQSFRLMNICLPPSKPKYANIEILLWMKDFLLKTNIAITDEIKRKVLVSKKTQLDSILEMLAVKDLCRGFNKDEKIKMILTTLSIIPDDTGSDDSDGDFAQKVAVFDYISNASNSSIRLSTIIAEIATIKSKIKSIETEITRTKDTLDKSIYSHNYAKNQILKIIAQWINGESAGYCFGFEGSPGIGKTSLAKKGLANCLIDEHGVHRPFSFISIGGSANGSTLEGHGYTYVNSTWGKIADILMESKCLNPVIYIDELDKVSKTDHGKEIIGILTHMIDYTQNDAFHDKYFNGIPIDLSKALIIFSYNDPEQIDKILLDRIHRIKFDNLTVDDKIVIVDKYILPELNQKMGLNDSVVMDTETMKYIIETYTVEPGVRKLKEILFDLYGDINLDLLQSASTGINAVTEFPIRITIDTIKAKYLKKYTAICEKKVHAVPTIGIINGLWANTMGRGGIIPIEARFFPTSAFLELRLTGLQGDVMKESMNVAKTLAWTLCSKETQQKWLAEFKDTQLQGLHIHCPDGAVNKDGPSAGAAITTTLYSLLNNRAINNTIGMTGEIDLFGNITAIGGLDCKIAGGIRAGIKQFLYPKQNATDFADFKRDVMDKTPELYADIAFTEINHITDILSMVFV